MWLNCMHGLRTTLKIAYEATKARDLRRQEMPRSFQTLPREAMRNSSKISCTASPRSGRGPPTWRGRRANRVCSGRTCTTAMVRGGPSHRPACAGSGPRACRPAGRPGGPSSHSTGPGTSATCTPPATRAAGPCSRVGGPAARARATRCRAWRRALPAGPAPWGGACRRPLPRGREEGPRDCSWHPGSPMGLKPPALTRMRECP
mmetsp:Transcript_7156/g.19959  ORF Transcript_7156/g.19959 Transcript_7156/m.19959 type:complete len:204 (+) Transcript_7156:21-632(+)